MKPYVNNLKLIITTASESKFTNPANFATSVNSMCAAIFNINSCSGNTCDDCPLNENTENFAEVIKIIDE
jgi:hypothetical protein